MIPINSKEPQKNLGYQSINNDLPRNIKDANRAIWNIFSKCQPVDGNEEIVITGQVLGDGRGDWAAMRNQQKNLHKMFPDRTVRIIASSTTKWEGQLEVSKKESEPTDLTYYGNSRFGGANVPLSAFPPETKVIEKVEQAGVVIEAGVSIGGMFPEDTIAKIKENSLKICEHDFETASAKRLSFDTELKTGLGPSRDGIFLSSNKKEYNWKDLANANLKTLLFENINPEMDDVDNYLANHACFFGYMSGMESYFPFIGEAVCFANANFPEKSIDICLPNIIKDKKVGFDEFMKSELAYIQLKSNGDINQVKIIWYDEGTKLERTYLLAGIENKGKGKELRILDPGSLSAKDFKMMISLSAPLVGCTGDNSLAQTLSMGKIPCYEPRFESKVNGLLTRIGYTIGYDSALYDYCEYRRGKHRVSREGVVHPELTEQAKKFGQIIRENFSFQPLLKGVVNEKLLRRKDKDFSEREDGIRQKYLDKKISIEEMESQIIELLSEKGMYPKIA
ncbi:MAG TPA: hypothetical protein VGP47_00890 [Parachlamydiaceae bacterium]|nr:hypothetical protein [Parachlamydiaceae bacterium]